MSDIQIEVKTLPAVYTLSVKGLGEYNETSKKNWKTLDAFLKESKVDYDQYVSFFYDNPNDTPAERLRSATGVSVKKEVLDSLKLEGTGVEPLVWEAGDYAVFLFKGCYSKLNESYEYLFNKWLPQQNRECLEYPSVEIYLNDCEVTPPEELLTLIHVRLGSVKN